jgi:IS4 transposase
MTGDHPMKKRNLLLALVLLLSHTIFAQAGKQTNAQVVATPQATGVAATDDEMIRLNKQVAKLFSERKYDEALPLARSAVEAGERLYGKDDLRLAPVIINLAVLNLIKSKRDEAELLFKRSITILNSTKASSARPPR